MATKVKKEVELTKKAKWMQPSIGVILLALFLIPVMVWQLVSNTTNATPVILMTLGGIFLGYSLSRSKFGFNGPIKKMVQNGDGRQAKALIYLFMIGSVIAGGAMLAFGPSMFGYPITYPLGLGTIIGGLLFGVGMILATGCASGTLTDVGDGILPAVVVLVFFMLGSTFGVAFYGSSADVTIVPKGTDTSLAGATGSIAIGVIINMLLLAIVLLSVILFHKYRDRKGTQNLFTFKEEALIIGDGEIVSDKNLGFWKSLFTYEKYKKLFMTRWTWIMGTMSVAAWFAYVIFIVPPYMDDGALTHETAGITGAYAKWGIWITQGFGIDKITSWPGYKHWNIIHDTQSWQNFGIIIGASVAKLSQSNFKIVGIKLRKTWHWALYALGGILMGLGARLARGCNFGALFTGVTFGTGFGWIFGIALFSAAALTAVITKKIRFNTPPSAYGKNK